MNAVPAWLPRAAAGALAGIAGLCVSLVVSAALRLRLSPVYAVAEAVIEVTPGKLALTLVHLVGRWDKPLLVAGTLLGMLALSAWAGHLSGRSARAPRAVFALMALVGAAAVLTRPEAGPTDVAPVLAGWLTWTVVLSFLMRALPLPASAAAGERRDPPVAPAPSGGRRTFLRRAGLVIAGSLVLAAGSRVVGRGRRLVETARSRLRLPVTSGVVPPGAEVGGFEGDAVAAGMETWRTPGDSFYLIDTAVVVPAIDVDTWRLRIHGMVENPITLSYADLLDRGMTEAWVTLCCVSNPVGGDLVGNAWWSGVRVADLLAEARPLPEADAVRQTSEDGWDCGTPLAALTDGRDALLAVAMNGEPLPLEHGFPVRMVVPGLYGYVSATKWLVDLEVTRFDRFEAFWTRRGWAAEGPVKTHSRIDVPGPQSGVMAGDVRVGGVAWAQHTGIAKVEVRVDGEPWQEVELGRVPSVDTWVQWAGTVRVDPGVHTVAVRATDRDGYTQTGVRADVVPDGATGWHSVQFTAE